MPNPRTDTLREYQRAQIAARYLARETQAGIAEALGISQPQVSRDLEVIRDRWRAAGVRDFDQARAEELARIDRLEAEYWDAWRRSCGGRTRSTARRAETPVLVEGLEVARRTTTTTEIETADERDGNPAYLAGVQWCIDRRIKLLGLDTPPKIDLTLYIQQVAERFGLDVSDVLADVDDLLRGR